MHNGIYERPSQMAAYVAAAQRAALARNGVPLFITGDHEGGHVRFMRSLATDVPSNMALGAAGDPRAAAEAASILARELVAVGVNWNLAPVADVNNNPANPVIGTRAFGDDPALVGAYAAAAIQAYQAAGILACAKHFPGPWRHQRRLARRLAKARAQPRSTRRYRAGAVSARRSRRASAA